MAEGRRLAPSLKVWPVRIVKYVVFLVAARYILGYFLGFDIADMLRGAKPPYIVLGCVLSLASFVLQIAFLKELSGERLTWGEAFRIEYYSFLMNLGVASSFFSLPKIALINKKIGDMGKSVRLFMAPMAVGVAVRAYVIVVCASALYLGQAAALFLGAALPAVVFIGCGSKRAQGRAGISPASKLIWVLFIGFLNILCVTLTYYYSMLALSASPPVLNAALAENIGYLAGLFSPMPSGLGVRETAIAEMNGLLEVTKGGAFAAAILYRFITVICPLVFGALAIGMGKLSSGGKPYPGFRRTQT